MTLDELFIAKVGDHRTIPHLVQAMSEVGFHQLAIRDGQMTEARFSAWGEPWMPEGSDVGMSLDRFGAVKIAALIALGVPDNEIAEACNGKG